MKWREKSWTKKKIIQHGMANGQMKKNHSDNDFACESKNVRT